MNRVTLISGLVVVAATGYYFALYPPVVMQRQTQQALYAFSKTTDTQDRTQISNALQVFLADNAQVHLETAMFSLREPEGAKPTIQDFDKPGFINYIYNTLSHLTDYHYEPQLKSFALSHDKTSAAITFSSKEWADGIANYEGATIGMRFSSDSDCTGMVQFESAKPRLNAVQCVMQMRMVPRADEMAKMHDPEVLRQVLR